MYYDFLIVGAGLFGSVFAHEMKQKNKKCLVIDKRSHIAGNIYTKQMGDINVHMYGAHIFHTNNEKVWRYINRFTTFNHYINTPLAIYKDEVYNLPFNMNTFAKLWGITTPAQAKAKIEEQTQSALADASGEGEDNLEQYALKTVGRDIYEKLIKGYTEKQWGRSCDQLPGRIIQRIPLRFVYDNNYFNERFQGIPENGYTEIIEKMLEGTEVRLNTDYKEFVKQYEKSEEISWGKVLYTGMIDEFYDYCFGPLEYRSLAFETEYLKDTDNYQGNAVVNYTSADIPYTRIIEHRHFVPDEVRDIEGTVITREYPQKWEQGLEPFYPVNDEKNNELYKKYRSLAKDSSEVIFGGRLGSYKYYNMDKIIESALNLAAVN